MFKKTIYNSRLNVRMCRVYFILDNLLECFASESYIILIAIYSSIKKEKMNKQVEIYMVSIFGFRARAAIIRNKE